MTSYTCFINGIA